MFEFKNTVIHLLGYPGVGKYTIAKELSKLAGFRIIDNQLINNPIFTVVGADGITPLPSKVWDYCLKIRTIVLEAIEELADPEANFALTNYITLGDEIDNQATIDRFAKRNAQYYPVYLHCDLEIHKTRVVSEDRKERMKNINPLSPDLNRTHNPLWVFEHPNRLEFDISSGTPHEAALNILSKITELQKGSSL